MIPTSAALDAFFEELSLNLEGREWNLLVPHLMTLRRLQHEATLDSVKPKVRVLDFEAARRLREEAGMACHDDDPEAA